MADLFRHQVVIDPGNTVLCDACSRDFTDSTESGGLLFQSKGIGPCCSKRWTKGAEEYDETHLITAVCPEGKSFADWVREDLR